MGLVCVMRSVCVYACRCMVSFWPFQPPQPYNFLLDTSTSTSVSTFFVLPYFSCFGEGSGLLSTACVRCVFCVLLKCHIGKNGNESWLATIAIQLLLLLFFFTFCFLAIFIFLYYKILCLIMVVMPVVNNAGIFMSV